MKASREDVEKALKVLVEAKLKTLKRYADDKDDAFDSYVHQQILQLYKEFPDLNQSLMHGYELFSPEG